MPIFEYVCQDCNATFEKLVFPTESEPPRCSKCDSINVKRLLSSFAFRTASGGTVSSGGSCSCCSSKNCSTCNH
ncbi:MAG: zinc ribbon domain-containing protein [Firmicutes bacterium]|nr:zinc ribbon domain-containing protein [Bacillota bacterium]HOB22849.1 zinc ribbon domain-containing protein [Bacillota bacterium]